MMFPRLCCGKLPVFLRGVKFDKPVHIIQCSVCGRQKHSTSKDFAIVKFNDEICRPSERILECPMERSYKLDAVATGDCKIALETK